MKKDELLQVLNDRLTRSALNVKYGPNKQETELIANLINQLLNPEISDYLTCTEFLNQMDNYHSEDISYPIVYRYVRNTILGDDLIDFYEAYIDSYNTVFKDYLNAKNYKEIFPPMNLQEYYINRFDDDLGKYLCKIDELTGDSSIIDKMGLMQKDQNNGKIIDIKSKKSWEH